jgi:hypothetical protein
MADENVIREVLAVYKKHGWELRRVLLTGKSRSALQNSLPGLFNGAPIEDFARDAAWFARKSGNDGEAWELRLLSEVPYALIEVFGPDQDENEREDIRHGMAERLLEKNPVKVNTGH